MPPGCLSDRRDRPAPERPRACARAGRRGGRRPLARCKLPAHTRLNGAVTWGLRASAYWRLADGLEDGWLEDFRLTDGRADADCPADGRFAAPAATALAWAMRWSLSTAAASPLVIQTSIGGTSACQVPMVCPPPGEMSTGTLAWCSWSSCAKYSALLTSALSPWPAPSQKYGMCAPDASAHTSSMG